MIVQLSADAPPRVADADRLDRLHAECTGPIGDADLGALCTRGPDDDHVWIDVAGLRTAGIDATTDPEFTARFDAMIGYARTKGWLDDAGVRVRAHVEPA